ncbi:hypothetical protein LCGC14_0356960 [marine sediment metagenome]|uniref:Uncharacterized protein n=1 Tax=marine sediment metagenome TaxID=412755 RepID=A0A0F9TRY2_9ZZZZ
MEWIMIITAIIEAIQECQENRDRDDIEAGLNKPGPRERWAIRRILIQEKGLRGKKLWRKVDEGMNELRALDSEDIQRVMASVPMPEGQ